MHLSKDELVFQIIVSNQSRKRTKNQANTSILTESCNKKWSPYKLKVARRGLYSTAALYIADCALVPNVVPSFISRGATTPSGAGAFY
jgi:hypothetical protein